METSVKIKATDIIEFNCMLEDPEKDGEYNYFNTTLHRPTSDLVIAVNRVAQQIKREYDEDDVIYVIGYWRGGGCYDKGIYESIGGMLKIN